MDMVQRVSEAIMARELQAERPDDDEQIEIK